MTGGERYEIRIAAEDILEIEELYRQLFAAMVEIQPEFIRPGFQTNHLYE